MKNPRIAVTLDAGVMDTFTRLGQVQGRPASKIAAEILTEMEPGLRTLVAIGEHLNTATEGQRKAIGDAAAAYAPDGDLAAAQALVDRLAETLTDIASAGGLTPPGNTGVRISRNSA